MMSSLKREGVGEKMSNDDRDEEKNKQTNDFSQFTK